MSCRVRRVATFSTAFAHVLLTSRRTSYTAGGTSKSKLHTRTDLYETSQLGKLLGPPEASCLYGDAQYVRASCGDKERVLQVATQPKRFVGSLHNCPKSCSDHPLPNINRPMVPFPVFWVVDVGWKSQQVAMASREGKMRYGHPYLT